jgi:pimeloyl-ACP methyl ester carboxylesterase
VAGWRRITGAAGVAAGVAAAGAGAVIAAERIAASRLKARLASAPPEPFGTLRGRELTVLAHDGVALHVESDGPDGATPALVFCHGYTLNQDCWHYQRRGLAGHRMIFWDQRDHGRSGRSPEGAASIDELGTDLKSVIDAATAPDEPVVLVGHSMGGMTIMALAEQHPELFGTKVTGVVLVSTCARGLEAGSPWMPGPVRPVLSKALPGVLSGAAKGRRALLVERGRAVTGDLGLLGTWLIGFGDAADVSPGTLHFLGRMIQGTHIEVVARFCQALMLCDKRDSLTTLGKVPVTVLVGERDRLIAPRLGLELAMDIPGAELVWVPGGGHVLILERPGLVNDAIRAMIQRAGDGGLPRSA